METKHLRTFVTVADLESFTRAGRRLGMSQSAISQQLSALERHLGVKVFVRSGSGARPTPAGEVLLQYARQILRKLDEAERVLTDEDARGRGLLRIGAGGAACHYLLPAILKEFHAQFGNVELHVLSGRTQLTVERLLSGDLDVGVLTLPVSEPRLRTIDLGRDELMAIVPGSHAWAARPRVHAREFAGESLLLYERRSQTFVQIERVLLEAGVFPRVAMEMDHLEAVVAMVRVGLGVAIVPRWTVAAEVASGQLAALPIGKSGLLRSWGLSFLDEGPQPKALRGFVQLCVECIPAMLSP